MYKVSMLAVVLMTIVINVPMMTFKKVLYIEQ